MSIETIIDDVYGLLEKGEIQIDAKALSARMAERLSEKRAPPALRMSNFATPDKQLWFHINRPDLAEPLPPWVRNKLLYGDIIEEYIISLIKQAGITVECEQLEVEYCGIKGHIDGLFNGVLGDVKSANSRSFEKFRGHRLLTDDAFGYLDQVSLYLNALAKDERLRNKTEASFIAVDKELGHICVDTYKKKELDYEKEIERKLSMLGRPTPPMHCCDPVPHGSSGNLKLGTRCKYNPYKFHCHPGLRAFQYSNGPVFLTKVVREPDVPEVTKQYV